MKLLFFVALLAINLACSIKPQTEKPKTKNSQTDPFLESLKSNISEEIKKETGSKDFAKKFLSKLEEWHPGDQDKIYHSFLHTLLVADLMIKVIKKHTSLTQNKRTLLLVAALLHDLDPNRPLNSQPSVEATIEFFDHRDASFIFDRVNKNKIATLIRYTDFHKDKEKQKELWVRADKLAAQSFKNDEWARKWGMNLALVDKLAMYIRDWPLAFDSVKKLAFEFKTSDEELLKNTYSFLKPLEPDLDRLNLSNDLRNNFHFILERFKKLCVY